MSETDPGYIEASFKAAVTACMADASFMAEYRRLSGSSFGAKQSPLDAAIDDATGYADRQCEEFFAFVRDVVWFPWVSEAAS